MHSLHYVPGSEFSGKFRATAAGTKRFLSLAYRGKPVRSLGIVVPAYRPDVDRLRSYVRALDERVAPSQILIELDAPRPGAVEALNRLPATVAAAPNRRGKGVAIAAGFDRLVRATTARRRFDSTDGDTNTHGDNGARRDGSVEGDGRDTSETTPESPVDVLAFFDADASTPPASAAAVVAPVLRGEYDLAVGSRRHPEAEVGRHQTFGRRRLGDAYAWTCRRLVEPSLFDYQCGAKALSAAVWWRAREYLREPGFGWDLDFLVTAAALGYEIGEIPITWYDRPRSTVPPARTAVALARGLYRARGRMRRLDAPIGGPAIDRKRGTEAASER